MPHPYTNLIPEIRQMREAVAALARAETDNVSYLAYLQQARSLRTMEEKATSIRHDAEARARREQLDEPQFCEQYYLEMLSDWLRKHAAETLTRIDGGDETMLPEVLKITRLYANRHHEMVGDLCGRYADGMEKQAAQMTADQNTFEEMRFSLGYGPKF